MSPKFILLVPLLAAANAYASTDDLRPEAIAISHSATRKAVQVLTEASTPHRDLHSADDLDGELGAVTDVAAENATRAVLRSEVWQDLLRDAQERAGGLAVTDDLQLRASSGPNGPLTTVVAAVYSGEGYALCGGDDFVSRVIGVVDESGRVVVPFFRVDGDLTSDGQHPC